MKKKQSKFHYGVIRELNKELLKQFDSNARRIEKISDETGYSEATIRRALKKN